MEEYYKLSKKLLMSGGYVSPMTGEHVSMTDADKLIYTVLKSRNEYFKLHGKSHYDTQDDISAMCNLKRRKVGETIRKLIDDGIVVATKRSGRNWTYEDVFPLSLWNVQTKESILHKAEKPLVGACSFLNDDLPW